MSNKSPTHPKPVAASSTSMSSKKKSIQQLKTQIKQLQNKNIQQQIRCLQLKNNADDLRVMMKKVYEESEQDLRQEREKEKKLVNEIKSLEMASKVAHSGENTNAKMGEYWKEFM